MSDTEYHEGYMAAELAERGVPSPNYAGAA